MSFKENFDKAKRGWHWLWYSDSIWSWLVAIIVIFIFVKFIFFPALSLIMGTSLPLAGVESSSMDHQIVKDDIGRLTLCDKVFNEGYREYINFDKYWNNCGKWYEDNGISKNYFSTFSLKNGFRKGDIIIVWGRFKPKVGDVIIFKPNSDSQAPRPIIHRIIKIDNGIMQTKGDHNAQQLTKSNNYYKTDETNITQEQIIGKAIFKIPYLGWIKILASEFVGRIFG